MLIGSKIKPRPNQQPQQRNVELFGTPYAFKNLAGDGHFVAEVKDPLHVETFLANDAFYAYNNEIPPMRRAAPPVSPVSPIAPAPAASDPSDTAAPPAPTAADANAVVGLGDFAPEIVAEARALLDAPVRNIGPALGKVSSPLVVNAALLIEQAKEEKDKRSTVVKMLGDCIEAMKAAKVSA